MPGQGYSDLKGSASGKMTSTLSRAMYPSTLMEVMEWGKDLWLTNGMYTQNIRKAVRYFMTELSIQGEDKDVEEQYREHLEDNYDLMEEGAKVGEEALAFGNSFSSIHAPFIRRLYCPECDMAFPYSRIKESVKFESTRLEFTGKCPGCELNVVWKMKDLPVQSAVPQVIRWDPEMIKISYNSFTKRSQYILNPKADTHMTSGIRKGEPFYMEDTPWEIVEAVSRNTNVTFNPDNIFHMKMEPPAFLSKHTRGWGLPPFMSDFSTVVLILLLDKYNEAITSDFMVPNRVITPDRSSAKGASPHMGPDLMSQIPFEDIQREINKIIEEHRKNPTSIHTAPFPLNYQIMGGEAKQLVQVELIQYYETRLLQDMGLEFVHRLANDQVGAMTSFRMFERTWQHFHNSLNSWFTWFANTVGGLKHWGPVTVETVPSSLYEDPEVKGMKVDLASAYKVSMDTALRSFGLNHYKEQEKIMEEELAHQELMRKKQHEMEERGLNEEALRTINPGEKMLMQQEQAMQEAEGGGAPPGGGGGAPPPAGGGGAPMGPGGGSQDPGLSEMDEQAQQLAQELIGMEMSVRNSELTNLKKQNPLLHKLVRGYIEEMESQGAMEGKRMMRQELQQESPGGAPPMG